MATKRCVYVLSETDGAKYKLVMQGDVQLLTAKKIKRYLEKATGIPAKDLHVRFNALQIRDDMSGAEMGLYDGATLHLCVPISASSSASDRRRTVATASSSLTARRDPNAGLAMPTLRPSPEKPARSPSRPEAVSGPSSLFARRIADQEAREVALSPAEAAAQLPYTPEAATEWSATHHHAYRPSQGSSRPSPDVETRLYENRTPSVSMPRTVVQGSLHPYGTEPSARLGSASQSSERGVRLRSTPRATVHSVAASLEEMEDELEAVRDENETLRNMLYDAERRAATASSETRLDSAQEEVLGQEVQALRAQLAAAHEAVEQARQEAVEEAVSHFAAKEHEMKAELTRVRRDLHQLQREHARHDDDTASQTLIASLRAELEDAREQLSARNLALQNALACPPSTPPMAGCPDTDDGATEGLARTALAALATELAVDPIELDESHTAVVSIDADLNLLVTLDPTSGRLFLYATLLSDLPQSPAQRLKLYEAVLEGALLGKDMAGASVGISKESNLVLMSTWIDVRYCHPAALAAMTQPFCEAVRYWIPLADEIAYA